MCPIANELGSEDTNERDDEQSRNSFSFKVNREARGITQRGKEIRDRCVIGVVVNRNPDEIRGQYPKTSSARSLQLRSQSRRLGVNRSSISNNGIGIAIKIVVSNSGSIQRVVTALAARMVHPKTKIGCGSDQGDKSRGLEFTECLTVVAGEFM